jgi:hypothetical protein
MKRSLLSVKLIESNPFCQLFTGLMSRLTLPIFDMIHEIKHFVYDSCNTFHIAFCASTGF